MKKMDKTTDIAEQILKVRQQLTFLDKKVDTLIAQLSKAPALPSHPQRQAMPGQAPAFRERQMHKAVCADCSKECEVPFRPTGERPVYCRECFAKRRQAGRHGQTQAPRPAVKAEETRGGFDKFRRPDARKRPYAKKKPAIRRRTRS